MQAEYTAVQQVENATRDVRVTGSNVVAQSAEYRDQRRK